MKVLVTLLLVLAISASEIWTTRTKIGSYGGGTGGYGGTTGHITRGRISSLSNGDSNFTIVLFPDIQNMVNYYPAVWEGMPASVGSNEPQNLQAVIGLGDNTNEPADSEIQEARKGWDVIDNTGLPYV